GLILVAILVGLPVLLAWLVVRALRPRSQRVQLVVAIVVTVMDVVVGTVTLPAVLFAGEPTPGPPLLWWALSIASVLVMLVLIRFGGGAILLWALRRALRQISRIGTMAARVLPLLILVVIFIFFTGELWQVLNRLTRAQMWAVVGFLALIAVGFVTATFSDELPGLRARSRTSAEVRAKVAGTPLEGATEAAVPRLSWPERVNVVLVLFVAQAMQIVVFTVLMFVFFVVFGALVITPDGQTALLGDQTSPPGTLFGIPIGLSNAMLHVSLFLAAFSGLSFAASTTAEEPYRGTFFNPLLDEVALSLAARDAYKATWPVS
ncbi:MAG: hypothetical protein ACRD0H_15310, partial [Actinomycetes bacterium]